MNTTKISLNWTCRAQTHVEDLGIVSGAWPDSLPVTGPGGLPLTVFLVQRPDYGLQRPAVYASGAQERLYELTVYVD